MTDREKLRYVQDVLEEALNRDDDDGLNHDVQSLLLDDDPDSLTYHLAATPEPAPAEEVGTFFLARHEMGGYDTYHVCTRVMEFAQFGWKPSDYLGPGDEGDIWEQCSPWYWELLHPDFTLKDRQQRQVRIMQQTQPDGTVRTWWQWADV